MYPSPPFSLLLLLLLLAACESGRPLTDGLGLDTDGDGVVNGEDCAPNNSDVWGDKDGDGWLDARCLDAIEAGDGYPVHVPGGYTAEEVYLDCDDKDLEIHPGGSWQAPEFYEQAPVHSEGTLSYCPPGEEAPPFWAADGVDNDCDGVVDVLDYDGDGHASMEVDGGDCNDCRPTVHPGIDERLTEGGCPVYAYDGFDNDCGSFDDATTEDDGDLVDFDGDGQAAVWATGSACWDVDNRTTGESLAQLTEPDEEWTGTDCYDLRDDIYLDAPEFCDWIDHDCNGQEIGQWDAVAPIDADAALNGFEVSEDGLRFVLIVDAETSATPATDTTLGSQTGRTSAEALPDLTTALPYLAICSEVHFRAGTYEESVAVDLDDLVGEDGEGEEASLQLHLVGSEEGVVLAGGSGPYLDAAIGAEQAVVVRGLSLQGGASGRGGLAVVGGALTLEDLTVSGITVDVGAPVSHEAGVSTSVVGLVATGNTGRTAGALALSAADIVLSQIRADSNVSETSGGALSLDGFSTATLDEVDIVGAGEGVESAWASGGGLYAIGQSLAVRGLTISGAWAYNAGGGLYVVADQVTLSEVDIDECGTVLGAGGGGHLVATTGSLEDITLQTNVSASDGGGLYVAGSSWGLTDVTATGNSASGNGGGISVVASNVAVDGLLASANTAAELGGGAYLRGSSVRLSGDTGDSSLSGNVAQGGGGVYMDGAAVELSDIHTSSNRASLGSGGGVAVVGEVVAIDTVELAGDTAAVDGGGLSLVAVSSLALSGVTADSCAAGVAGGGVALSVHGVEEDANVVEDLTVTCDGDDATAEAQYGGGIVVEGSTLSVAGLAVEGCSAEEGGGGYLGPLDAIVLEDLVATGCTASELGGGVAVDALAVTGRGWALSGNIAPLGGGLMANGVSDLDLEDCDISENRATGAGGGVFALRSNLRLGPGTVIRENTARTSDSDASSSEWCAGDERGGGVYHLAGETLEIEQATISENRGCFGAGVAAVGVSGIDVQDATVSGNSTFGLDPSTSGFMRNFMTSGGGLYVSEAATLVIDGTLFDGNSAGYEGGGLYVHTVGAIDISNSRFLENTVDVLGYPPIGLVHGVKGRGGAVFGFDTDIAVTHSEFLENRAQTGANGLHVEGGSVEVEYALFYGGESDSSTSRAAHVAADYGVIEYATFVGSRGTTSFEWMGSTYSYGLYNVDFGIGPEDSDTGVDTSIFAHSDGVAVHGEELFQAWCDLFWEVSPYEDPVFGGGDIEADPLFTSYTPDDSDPTNDDLRLGSGSPALSPGCGFGEIGAYGYGADWSSFPY